MFKFGFDVEQDDESDLNLPGPSSQPEQGKTEQQAQAAREAQQCHHISFDDLLDTLPDRISYSPIHVPGLTRPLLRRDLFDARFQLYQRGSSDEDVDSTGDLERRGDCAGKDRAEAEGEEYVDSSTDLVPGLYEGGLKTWEGGVDLVEVLNGVADVDKWVRGASVLEVGCGTSLPSAFLLGSLFSFPPPPGGTTTTPPRRTVIHLQDYNKPVLSLVSLPNMLLALLPHFPPEALHEPQPTEEGDDELAVEDVLPDTTQPGLLAITPRVKDAFKRLLEENGIELRFTYGGWAGLAADLRDGSIATGAVGTGHENRAYDLVLTSETIYAEDSVDDLVAVLRAATASPSGSDMAAQVQPKHVDIALEDSLGGLKLEAWKKQPLVEGEGVVMVAAKVLYFGVGGGLQDFLLKVERGGGWYENLKEWVVGVGRKVVRVGW